MTSDLLATGPKPCRAQIRARGWDWDGQSTRFIIFSTGKKRDAKLSEGPAGWVGQTQ